MSRLSPLAPEEAKAVERLESRQRSWRRGAYIQRENDQAEELVILSEGWVIAATLMNDGSRQIVQVHLPGELMGSANLMVPRVPMSLCAITEVTAAMIDRGAMARLLADHPRLASHLLAMAELERLTLADRIASLGRGSGRARLAAFLLDLLNRLRRLDPSVTDQFSMRLTQEQIGDATGLTAVHVNRMMRALVEEGSITRDGSMVTVLDEPKLMRLAHYVERETIDTSWIPEHA
ncbi:CRP-like cAMP-binding protein [Sphingomonas jejuensis]|uniref:CRP-like cAMP-binding protein n=1 Tax=Sphingomonas jejuensis TaxID=904715 RepID=A0ABX0XPR6_9SPHN|nr:Crp/Fnr family transcriptional regulator [Sphingomonas jejuensis]NJC34779.1 CRP-like cAMP-binding protein [Sphingomonas jejuensis]